MIVSCTMTQPFTGCSYWQPDFDMDPVMFNIAFDGDASALWFYQVGPGEPDTGSFPYHLRQPLIGSGGSLASPGFE